MPETPVLYYLHTFQTVAHEQSFTRAGHRLNLSQPAVSAHIRALEQYYGAKLFETRQRRTCLTAAGKALLAYTNRVFHLLDEADQVVDATRAGQRGVLRFGASTTLGNYLLPRVLGGYARAHPEVTLETVIGTSADVLGWVKSEAAQFGLVEAPLRDADIVAEAIGDDELILAAAATHRLARVGPMRPNSLAQIPILRREATSGTQQLVDVELTRSGANSPTQMVLGSTEALKQAVIQGVGVAWLPQLAVVDEVANGELSRVAVDGLAICRTFSLIHLRGARLSAAAEALVEDVRAALA
jgi:LysR family transcriptional regulator, transcriptional activator of the cysJI operon